MMTVKVPGIYYVSVMFGVTKKAWYLHLRKNGVYIASVQKDYNAGYEDSLNLHAIGYVLIQIHRYNRTFRFSVFQSKRVRIGTESATQAKGYSVPFPISGRLNSTKKL